MSSNSSSVKLKKERPHLKFSGFGTALATLENSALSTEASGGSCLLSPDEASHFSVDFAPPSSSSPERLHNPHTAAGSSPMRKGMRPKHSFHGEEEDGTGFSHGLFGGSCGSSAPHGAEPPPPVFVDEGTFGGHVGAHGLSFVLNQDDFLLSSSSSSQAEADDFMIGGVDVNGHVPIQHQHDLMLSKAAAADVHADDFLISSHSVSSIECDFHSHHIPRRLQRSNSLCVSKMLVDHMSELLQNNAAGGGARHSSTLAPVEDLDMDHDMSSSCAADVVNHSKDNSGLHELGDSVGFNFSEQAAASGGEMNGQMSSHPLTDGSGHFRLKSEPNATIPAPKPQYSLYAHIGDGAFSEVFKVRYDGDDQTYALKRSKRRFRSRSDRRFFLKEFEQSSKLKVCVNVVKYYRCWQEDGHLFTQIEYCALGTLDAFLRTRYEAMWKEQDEHDSKRMEECPGGPKMNARRTLGRSDSVGMECELRPPSRCSGKSDSIGAAPAQSLEMRRDRSAENMRKTMHLHIKTQQLMSRPGSPRALKDHLDEEIVWRFMVEIATGLQCIHEAGLVHLDIKPQNILISCAGVLKIGDFGQTTPASKVDASNVDRMWLGDADGVEGDNRYMAKELLRNTPLDQSADMFSFGLVMLEIAAGFDLPAEGDDWHVLRQGEIPRFLKDQRLSHTLWTELRRFELQVLVSEMIQEDASKRPTSLDIVQVSREGRSQLWSQ